MLIETMAVDYYVYPAFKVNYSFLKHTSILISELTEEELILNW